MNTRRGLWKALLFGSFGFLIPVVLVGALDVGYLAFGNVHPLDRDWFVQQARTRVLFPAVGCGLAFALAAYASYAPRIGNGWVRNWDLMRNNQLPNRIDPLD